jgi:hypothetical protein
VNATNVPFGSIIYTASLGSIDRGWNFGSNDNSLRAPGKGFVAHTSYGPADLHSNLGRAKTVCIREYSYVLEEASCEESRRLKAGIRSSSQTTIDRVLCVHLPLYGVFDGLPS